MKDETLKIILKEFSFFHEQFNIIQNQFNLFHEQFNLIREQFNQMRAEINEIRSEMKLLNNKVDEYAQIVKDLTNFNYITENDLKRFAKANNLEFKYS